MRMPLPASHRLTVLTRALCLLAATALFGCASKNPLMEEPVATAAPTTKPAQSAPAPVAAQAPVATPTTPATPTNAAEATPAKPAAGGVQTTESRRFFGILSPYRIDIQQGNFISREMVAQLKPGMTREQVRFALGTPLLTDIFHADRWDYVFRMKKGTGEIISSKVVVHFKDNRLATVDGADLPIEKDYLSLIAPPKAK